MLLFIVKILSVKMGKRRMSRFRIFTDCKTLVNNLTEARIECDLHYLIDSVAREKCIS